MMIVNTSPAEMRIKKPSCELAALRGIFVILIAGSRRGE